MVFKFFLSSSKNLSLDRSMEVSWATLLTLCYVCEYYYILKTVTEMCEMKFVRCIPKTLLFQNLLFSTHDSFSGSHVDRKNWWNDGTYDGRRYV